jgi:hypothetical protein
MAASDAESPALQPSVGYQDTCVRMGVKHYSALEAPDAHPGLWARSVLGDLVRVEPMQQRKRGSMLDTPAGGSWLTSLQVSLCV